MCLPGSQQEGSRRLMSQQLVGPLPVGRKAADVHDVWAHPHPLVQLQHRQHPAGAATCKSAW